MEVHQLGYVVGGAPTRELHLCGLTFKGLDDPDGLAHPNRVPNLHHRDASRGLDPLVEAALGEPGDFSKLKDMFKAGKPEAAE